MISSTQLMAARNDLTAYVVDGITPKSALTPSSLADLQDDMRQLRADSLATIPISGATRLSVGNVPTQYDVALDLSLMPSVFEHEPGDMTAICDANVNVAQLESALNAGNQRLPFTVPRANGATVGGSVASNAGGRLRPRFGGIRDWVIGMHVVSPDGVVTKSGGRVVKNVQGFELHRLHTGAFGTLGIITNVAFKLVPIPKASSTLAMWFDEHDSAIQATQLLATSGYEMDSLRLYSGNAAISVIRDVHQDQSADPDLNDDSPTFLLVTKVAGSAAAVRSQAESVRGLSGTLPTLGFAELRESADEIWDYLDSESSQGELVVQFTGLPSNTAKLLRRLQRILSQTGWESESNMALDGGYGTLQMSVKTITHADESAETVERITSTARECQCDYLIERCPTEIKSNLDIFGIDPALEVISRRTKKQFDPNSIINRGRYAFRI